MVSTEVAEVAKGQQYADVVNIELARLCDLIVAAPEVLRPELTLNSASLLLDLSGHVVSRSDFRHLGPRLFLMSAEAEQMARVNNIVWPNWAYKEPDAGSSE